MKMVITKQFQQFLAQYNVDPGQILEKARIPNYLWKEELSLDVPQYYRFLETLSTELTDTQLLAVSDVKDMGLFMPPFFAALCAADGLQAIKRLATYKKLIGPIKFDVQTAQDSVEIGISYLYPEQPLPRFALLNEQLIILSIVRMGTGKAIVPTGITGPYPYHHMIENTIGISATQSSDNRLVFKRSDLEQPFLTQNNTMWQFLEPEFKRQLATLNHDQPFVNAMRKELYRAIAAGDYAIETIARNLGVSVRTLQRNLATVKTSFKAETRLVQKDMAIGFAQNVQLSTTEIAYLVGYTEASSFTRAFKSWTGQTLNQYRQTHLAEN